jgi:hypothetical protein
MRMATAQHTFRDRVRKSLLADKEKFSSASATTLRA